MMKVFKIIGIIFVFLLTCGLFFYFQFRAPQKTKERERFVIKLDAREEQIVADLKEKGFLHSPFIFSLILGFKKWHGRIEPGAYMISKGMNAYKLAGALIYGPYQKWVLIPPGKRKEQVALILKESLDWPDDMVLNFIKLAREGYLWPDTYLFNTDADPAQIARRLEDEFSARLSELKKDLKEKNVSLETAVVMASLIERESGSLEDKPIIAGILWNRLKKKMKLEVDATVQYVIGSNEFNAQVIGNKINISEDFSFWAKLGSGIVRTIASPYNTYKIKALPAGPICSPSLDSLKAVINPVKTDALYYLHSSDKVIHVAKTFKEHQENIEKYLQ